jgi:hypothetical protein
MFGSKTLQNTKDKNAKQHQKAEKAWWFISNKIKALFEA